MIRSDGERHIIVCVDDFALTEPACAAAIRLVEKDAISAVSSVVDGAYVCRFASSLNEASERVSLGLHLNLTEQSVFPYVSTVRGWLLRGYVPQRGLQESLRAEIHRQLDEFERIYGRVPAFVDGHEHVHQFSAVRTTLIEALLARYQTRVAIRSTVAHGDRGLKARLIASLGGYSLLRMAREYGLHLNQDFAGVYDFSTAVPYEERMQAWLHAIADGGLIMCHPEYGHARGVHNAREMEFEYLQSSRWKDLRDEAHLSLIRFCAPLPA